MREVTTLASKSKVARISTSILTTIALFFWLQAIGKARLNLETTSTIGGLGLVTILPITYFVSISLLISSFLITLRSNEENRVLLLSQVIMLIFFLSFTPTAIQRTARFGTTYSNYQSVDYISQKDYINPSVYWLHNWPGFSIAFSALMQITTLPEQIILTVYPTVYNILLLFPLYIVFCLITSNEKYKWIAIWIFYIANWFGQDYFSAQSLGFFTFVLILFTIFKCMKSHAPVTHARHWLAILILLFSSLVLTHMLSSIALLAIIFVYFVSKYLRRPILVAFLALLFVCWTIYGAATYLDWNLPDFITQALNFELIFQANVAARVAGSTARIAVAQIRLIFSAIILVFAFSGIVLVWKHGKIRNVEKTVLFMLVGILPLLFLFVYGGELFMRIFLFSLVPLAYFISKSSNYRVFFCALAIFLVVVAPPLHVLAHYGNEKMDYVPLSETRGVEYFYNATTRGYVILSHIRDFTYRQSYKIISLEGSEWVSNVLSFEEIEFEHMDWPRFVCVSYGTREYYDFFLGDPQFIVELYKNMSDSIHYNKIYSNPSFDVYVES